MKYSRGFACVLYLTVFDDHSLGDGGSAGGGEEGIVYSTFKNIFKIVHKEDTRQTLNYWL